MLWPMVVVVGSVAVDCGCGCCGRCMVVVAVSAVSDGGCGWQCHGRLWLVLAMLW